MKIRFEYQVRSRASDYYDAADFADYESLEDLIDELMEQAPEPEWSVHVNKDDAQALWEQIQKLRDKP